MSVVDSDLSSIYLRLRAKFGPDGLRGFRAYSRHMQTNQDNTVTV